LRLRSDGDVKAGSLRDALPDEPQPEELVDILLESPGLRLERIVSTGQAMGEENWFDQRWDEFVVVVSGSARLRIEGENEDRMLEAGDWILLPAHCRHRVTWTQSRPPTVWLAVHYEDTLNRREAEER
jgi:cupin 2 domain-containing protein